MPKNLSSYCEFDTRINNSTWVNFSAVSKLKKEMFALQDQKE